MKSLLDRFQEKYVCNLETGCWEWVGSKRPNGYGHINAGGPDRRMLSSHRVSYELFVGPIPNGLHVLHECDNHKCVNPEHLFLGTNADNVKDKVAKDRQAKGSKHGGAILHEKDVVAIKEMLRRFPSTRKRAELAWGVGAFLAEWFSVHTMTIQVIKIGKTWSHL